MQTTTKRPVRRSIPWIAAALLLCTTPPIRAQRANLEELGASPQAIGAAGIAWYTTWDSALAEARRSNRPIFFMSAAATCSGIPGVF